MSGEDSEKTSVGTVVAGGDKPKKTRTRLGITLVVLVVLALVCGGYALLHRHSTSKTTKTKTVESVLPMDTQELGSAQATVNSDAKSNASPDIKAQHYIQLGDAQYNVNNYKESVAAYEKSLTFKGGDANRTNALQGLVYAYERVGRHQDAIKTAQQLVDYYKAQPKNDLTAQTRLVTYSGILTDLQQGKAI
ncbi:MAG: hypothetical protein ACREGB_03975 [Candidatus Saccharimonadales bacterium]